MTARSKPKLNQLEMLVAAADLGSFGAAAAELMCTQSRISHGIAELERCLGTRLLARSRSGCVPTDAGHRVLLKARQILQLSASLSDVAAPAPLIAGCVRIACFRSIATHLLPAALGKLAQRHPQLRIDIDDSCEEREQVARQVADGLADLGIAQLPIAQPLLAGFVTRPYISDSYVLVVPASQSLAAPVSWDQLRHLPFIQLDCSGALAISRACSAAGFDAQPSQRIKTDSAIIAMVQHGLGYSILPRLAVFPPPSGVVTLDLPIAAGRQFALVASADGARTPAVREVLATLRNQQVMRATQAFRAGCVRW